jgi:formate dehydrogenase major subunit
MPKVIIVIGANPTINHPVAATFIKNAVKQKGAKLIVMDPRHQTLSRHAYKHLAFKPGTDVATLNAMLNVIVNERLYDEQYIAGFTENFEALKERIQDFTPRKWRPSAVSKRKPCARWRGSMRVRGLRSSSGAWASASMCTAPTIRAA